MSAQAHVDPPSPVRSDSEEFEEFLRKAEETRKSMSKPRWLVLPIVSGVLAGCLGSLLVHFLI